LKRNGNRSVVLMAYFQPIPFTSLTKLAQVAASARLRAGFQIELYFRSFPSGFSV
jgi:hypothetical protein